MKPLHILICSCALLFSLPASAQLLLTDSAIYRQSVDSLLAVYKNQVGTTLHLYNGSRYIRQGLSGAGTPFFLSDSLLKASLYYDGCLYNDADLHYDLLNDEIVINDYTQNVPVRLVTGKIKYFTILNHRFLRLVTDSIHDPLLKTGFYEYFPIGKGAVLVKREKKLELPARADDILARFNS